MCNKKSSIIKQFKDLFIHFYVGLKDSDLYLIQIMNFLSVRYTGDKIIKKLHILDFFPELSIGFHQNLISTNISAIFSLKRGFQITIWLMDLFWEKSVLLFCVAFQNGLSLDYFLSSIMMQR